MIPAGTQMMMPSWIYQQYLLNSQRNQYGSALRYLMLNYGRTYGETTYIPLVRRDRDRDKKKKSYTKYDYDDYYYGGRRSRTYSVPVDYLVQEDPSPPPKMNNHQPVLLHKQLSPQHLEPVTIV